MEKLKVQLTKGQLFDFLPERTLLYRKLLQLQICADRASFGYHVGGFLGYGSAAGGDQSGCFAHPLSDREGEDACRTGGSETVGCRYRERHCQQQAAARPDG